MLLQRKVDVFKAEIWDSRKKRRDFFIWFVYVLDIIAEFLWASPHFKKVEVYWEYKFHEII